MPSSNTDESMTNMTNITVIGGMMLNESISCLDDVNVTESMDCARFCANETGDMSHSFGAEPDLEEYYCICTALSNNQSIYCTDNIDEWDDLSNLTSFTRSNATTPDPPPTEAEEEEEEEDRSASTI